VGPDQLLEVHLFLHSRWINTERVPGC
jgi:hypothetical protein